MDRGMCPGFPEIERIFVSAAYQSSPEVDEVLFVYIVVASHAVSLVLIWVDNGVQRPVITRASHYTRPRSITYHWKRPFW